MTQSSQPKRIRISLAFRTLLGVALIARANTIVTQMTGNVNFTKLPFALSVLNAAIAAYLASLASALDGGKNYELLAHTRVQHYPLWLPPTI